MNRLTGSRRMRLLMATTLLTACYMTTVQAEQANLLTRFAITWHFDKDYTVGEYANGDYWVLDPGTGVTITAISPKSTDTDGRVQHGSMLNPVGVGNGYDSTMKTVGYSADLNVGRPNGSDISPTNPLVVTSGNSLVSSRTHDKPGTRPQLTDVSVLTVVSSKPRTGAFRPPYSGTDKRSHWNISDIRWDLLPKLKRSVLTATIPKISSKVRNLERTWLEQGGAIWTGREFHPSNNMPDYGGNMARSLGDAALVLLLDYPKAELERLMVCFLQYGIDIYGVTEATPDIIHTTTQGGLWMGGGGHGHGRKWPIVFAGLMLDDSNIYKYVDSMKYPIFQERQQTFYVSQADVDRKRYTADGRPREPYTEDMIGTPEWGEQHSNQPVRDGSNFNAAYRTIVSPSQVGQVLAALLMGQRSAYNWDAYFDYADRYNAWADSLGVKWSKSAYSSPFALDMWDHFRASVPDGTGEVGPSETPTNLKISR